jgi:Cytochrome P450
MQRRKISYTRVTSYRKVRFFLTREPISIFEFEANFITGRCIDDRKYMVCSFHHVLHWQPALIIYRAILHDPSVYPEPDVFRPERFLNPDGSLRDDPILVSTFGYGRRICPGRHFVDATLFITVASLFSVFDISKGQGRPFSYSYTGTIIRYDYTSPVNDRHLIVSISQPNSFPCSIIPRDEKAEALILACKSES